MARAQTSLFIIIGVVIALTAIIFFMSRGMLQDDDSADVSHPFDITPVRDYVESCLTQATGEAVKETAFQGGFYSSPPGSLAYFDTYIPYYFRDDMEGGTQVPPRDTLEESLAAHTKLEMMHCIDGFKGFGTQLSAKVKTDEPRVTTILTNESVISEASAKVLVTKGGAKTELSSFKTELDTPLGAMHATAGDIANDISQREGFCISCFHDKASGAKSNLSFYTLANNSFLFRLERGDLEYQFAIRRSLDKNRSEGFSIEPIQKQSAFAGYPFHLDVSAGGKGVHFSDNSPLFDIDNTTGVIDFVPGMDDSGRHFIRITAEDAEGNVDNERFILEINFSAEHPHLQYIGHKVAHPGERFIYDVNASYQGNDTVYYDAKTDLFNITPYTGLINFTPSEEDTGEHTINITAVTDDGGYDAEPLTLIIA